MTSIRYPALKRILCAVVNNEQDMGYCQGLNYLAATVYLNLGNEEDTFWMLTHLLREHKYKAMYAGELKRFKLSCYQLECIVQKQLPKLAHFFVSP